MNCKVLSWEDPPELDLIYQSASSEDSQHLAGTGTQINLFSHNVSSTNYQTRVVVLSTNIYVLGSASLDLGTADVHTTTTQNILEFLQCSAECKQYGQGG